MLEKLNKYYEDGLLYKQVHPTLPLTIWNYTEKVQYENLWDEVTLMCRGLVTDDKGDIIAKPFKKFFNIEEGKYTPTENFEVFEKMDGSLGIVFWYEGQWILATRGSFTSDQAIKGTEILKRYNTDILFRYMTFCLSCSKPVRSKS
jgi:RNA ligase